MPEKYFNVEGIATFVHHLGATSLPGAVPDLSRGETVLCLHGAGGNGAVFRDVMEGLAAQHSPLAFDQPGHARSGELDSLGSIARMSAFTRAFLDRLGIEHAVLLGHSMGGAVALRTALAAPERVRALILVGTGGRIELPGELLEQIRLITEGKARRQFMREPYASSCPPEIMRKGFMEELKTDPRVLHGDLLACRDWDADAELGSLRVPSLVAVGAEEVAPLQAQAERLVSAIPGARRVTIEKAGHMLPLEQPGLLADAVNQFLGELGS